MYNRNNQGPSTVHCGAHDSTSTLLECDPSTCTLCVLWPWVRKALIYVLHLGFHGARSLAGVRGGPHRTLFRSPRCQSPLMSFYHDRTLGRLW